MSKIFYDELVNLDEVEKRIKKIARTSEEREELYSLVDEILHHKVVGCILDRMPEEHHEEFLHKFSERPHDTGLFHFISERVREDVREFIREEVHRLSVDLLRYVEFNTRPEKTKKIKTSKKRLND